MLGNTLVMQESCLSFRTDAFCQVELRSTMISLCSRLPPPLCSAPLSANLFCRSWHGPGVASILLALFDSLKIGCVVFYYYHPSHSTYMGTMERQKKRRSSSSSSDSSRRQSHCQCPAISRDETFSEIAKPINPACCCNGYVYTLNVTGD